MPDNLDFICISPKVAEHVVEKNFRDIVVDELKYVWHTGKMGLPVPLVQADHYFLSPEFKGDQIDRKNLDYCIELCKSNPKWRLSVQTHKIWRIS